MLSALRSSVGELTDSGGYLPGNYPETVTAFRADADRGDPRAQTRLGEQERRHRRESRLDWRSCSRFYYVVTSQVFTKTRGYNTPVMRLLYSKYY